MNPAELPTRQEVLKTFLDLWKPTILTESIRLENAAGRTLSKNLYSKNALPVVRSAAMDGIAVSYDEFDDGMPDTSKWVRDVDYCLADTGDDFDDRFDTVIMIEDVNFLGSGGIVIAPGQPENPGQHVIKSGEILRKGEFLVRTGTTVNALHLNILASGGHSAVPVVKRPKLIYIPSGNELIPAGRVPQRGENILSNDLMAESLVNKWGGDVIIYPICKDTKDDIKAALRKALKEGDMVFINGGTSKGSEDFNGEIIEELSSWSQHGVKVAPGKSMSIGLIESKPVINSPGPPMPNFCVLNWCIRPLVYAFMGISAPNNKYAYAVLETDLRSDPEMERYQLLKLSSGNNCINAKPLSFSNGTTGIFSACNGFSLLKAGEKYERGDTIRVEWLD